MKKVVKAYKCAFPSLYSDHYNDYMWQDDKQFEVIYGVNWKAAVKKRCSNDEFETYWQLKQAINTRRFPEMDRYSQSPSLLLADLEQHEIKHLLHSLGVKLGDHCPDEFYRNYSAYQAKHEHCDKLVSLGLMENRQQFNNEIYHVTELGIQAVKTLLLVTIDKES